MQCPLAISSSVAKEMVTRHLWRGGPWQLLIPFGLMSWKKAFQIFHFSCVCWQEGTVLHDCFSKARLRKDNRKHWGNRRTWSSVLKMECEERQRHAQWRKSLRLNSALAQGKHTRVQGSHCGMILWYEFWEARFLEGWPWSKPSAGVSHTPSSSGPSLPSALIQPGSSSDWGADTWHQNGEFTAKAECLFAEMGQVVPVRNLHIFGNFQIRSSRVSLRSH